VEIEIDGRAERVTVTAPAWREVEEALLAADIGGREKLNIKNMFEIALREVHYIQRIIKNLFAFERSSYSL